MNGILIYITEYPLMVAIKVNDFSKKEVINVISNYTGINSKNIEELSASTSYGLYCIKQLSKPTILAKIKEYSSNDCPFVFEVNYIEIL